MQLRLALSPVSLNVFVIYISFKQWTAMHVYHKSK